MALFSRNSSRGHKSVRLHVIDRVIKVFAGLKHEVAPAGFVVIFREKLESAAENDGPVIRVALKE